MLLGGFLESLHNKNSHEITGDSVWREISVFIPQELNLRPGNNTLYNLSTVGLKKLRTNCVHKQSRKSKLALATLLTAWLECTNDIKEQSYRALRATQQFKVYDYLHVVLSRCQHVWECLRVQN